MNNIDVGMLDPIIAEMSRAVELNLQCVQGITFACVGVDKSVFERYSYYNVTANKESYQIHLCAWIMDAEKDTCSYMLEYKLYQELDNGVLDVARLQFRFNMNTFDKDTDLVFANSVGAPSLIRRFFVEKLMKK